MLFKLLTVTCATLLTLTLGHAGPIKNPNDLKWTPLPNNPGLEYTVLSGNPIKTGLFTVRLKLPKNYSDVVHEHAKDRLDTIISGTYYIGFGNSINKDTATKMDTGTFINFPAHAKHYGFTNEETIIQISGLGPWDVLKSAGVKR